MAIEFKLPDIGEGVAEGEIVKWLVAEGDAVEEHQSVVEVMTDKATVEVPAPAAGVIKKLHAGEGDVVPVGDVIFTLDGDASASEGSAPEEDGDSADTQQEPAAQDSEEDQGSEEEQESEKQGSKSGSARQNGSAKSKSGGKKLEFKLPDIGEGVAEGEIVKWLVSEGDTVSEHQSVVEVMTDKATVEVPSPADGKILALLAAEGDTVPVGEVIFHLGTAGAGAEAEAETDEAEAEVAAAAPQKAAAGAPSSRSAAPQAPSAPARMSDEKVLAVPSARRVARDLGIDLREVSGTGRNGVIRRADVESFASGRSAAPKAPSRPATAPASAAPERPSFPPVSVPAGERETRTPFRGVRRKISEAMVRSMYTAPHFTVVEEVDVTEFVKLRASAKELGAAQGIKVTYMPFIMKAVALGLQRFPMLNGRLDEEANELVHYNYVNLGIAADTDNGLIVPVIPEVQAKGVLQLASELQDLAERTRSGKVSRDELTGSTFSITNAGNIGGTLATPIINFPDIAILGVHRLMKRPGVVETPEGDRIEVRQYMNFSLSVDHRLADGADGARFLTYLKQLLECPGLLSL